MNVDDGSLRMIPAGDPLRAREVEIEEKLAEKIMELRRTAICKECGTEMASDGKATTGTCGRCMDKHYVKEVMQLGLTEPMSRAERRRLARRKK